MSVIVPFIGWVIAGIGVVALVAPSRVSNALKGLVETAWATPLAAGLRLILGAALIVAAPQTGYPAVIMGLGVVMLLSALAILIAGPARLRAIVGWWLARPSMFIRLWAAVAIALGAGLVWAGLSPA